jgi:hypothetical protein
MMQSPLSTLLVGVPGISKTPDCVARLPGNPVSLLPASLFFLPVRAREANWNRFTAAPETTFSWPRRDLAHQGLD